MLLHISSDKGWYQYIHSICHCIGTIDLLVMHSVLISSIFFNNLSSIGCEYAAHKVIKNTLAWKSCFTARAVLPEKFSNSMRLFNNLYASSSFQRMVKLFKFFIRICLCICERCANHLFITIFKFNLYQPTGNDDLCI
jgi:hypothetical protein